MRRDGWQIAHVAHLGSESVVELSLELGVKILNVVLDTLNQLCLVLANGAADTGSDEQIIELAEDAEHLVGILRSAELITKTSRDTGLNAVNALLISAEKCEDSIKPVQGTEMSMLRQLSTSNGTVSTRANRFLAAL